MPYNASPLATVMVPVTETGFSAVLVRVMPVE